MTFTIQRGTNISHWLSQSKRRGAERKAWFTEPDVKRLADLGLDHLRIPIDEEQMWDERGAPESEAFDLLHSALGWCDSAGLRAVVDLHILRSHYFLDASPKLYTDPAEAERFVSLWRSLSEQLHGYSVDKVAYELLNESVAHDPEDWNRVSQMAFRAVRELEPERTIVLGSNMFCMVHTFDQLAVPDDEHLILTFHFYHPMIVTHYTAPWVAMGDYRGPINYPGQPIDPADLEQFKDKLINYPSPEYEFYDCEAMQRDLIKPLAVRTRTGHPLYCGEFGCYHGTPQHLRAAWYRDFIHVLKTNQIAWANWDFKGDFGLYTANGPDQEIIDILMA
jgi:endoglucanase